MALMFSQREERVEANLPITVAGAQAFQGKIKNINRGGVFVETPYAFPINTPLKLSIPLEQENEILFSGKVVHAYAAHKTKPQGLGIQFLQVEDDALKALQQYLIKNNHFSELLSQVKKEKRIDQLDCKLFIGGKEIDTGVYTYLPDTSKLLTDYSGVKEALKQVKAGQSYKEYSDYLYGRCCIGTSEHNQQAMEAAFKASRTFKYFPLAKRREILETVKQLLCVHRDRMLEIMIAEGHARELAEWEYNGMCELYNNDTLDFYQHCLSRKIGDVSGGEIYIIRRPDGVVAVSPPTNAPCSNSLIAGFALLSGNALVIKPPIHFPLSIMFLWKEIFHRAAQKCGAPDGIINLVLGDSKVIIDEWIHSPYINDIFFFGPSELGLEIGQKAYANGKKPILELSGNDMMMIWKDADLEDATEALKDGFLGSTQICMVPKKALIHEEIFESFAKKFVEKSSQLKPGLPHEKGVYLSPVTKIAEFYEFLEDAVSKGAKVVCGARQLNYKGEEDSRGGFIEPTVLLIEDVAQAMNMRCIWEENFFPLIPLVKISSQDNNNEEIFSQMMTILDKNDYGLRTSVWVKSEEYLEKFTNCAHNSGLLMINARHVIFNKYLGTHGGVKKSGGPYGEMNHVWEKTSHAHGVFIGGKKELIHGSAQQ